MLSENHLWSESIKKRDPEYFRRLAKGQHPDVLWIGCSDSRVPAETVVNANPGSIFVHRNIANQMIMTDFNCLSVLQYAVMALKVKHVIVCGHYGCGGVKGALAYQSSSLIITNKWLSHIKDIYRLHYASLEELDEGTKLEKLVELNVIEQVHRLSHTSIIQNSWKTTGFPSLHGWVYSLEDGLLKELISIDQTSPILPIYQYNE